MARKLIVEVVGDARSLERTYDRAQKSTRAFGREMSTATRGVAAGSGIFASFGRSIAFASAGFLGAAGLTSAVRASFQEMFEGQKVAAQTAQVLKTTGSAANVTAAQVDRLASALMRQSGIDDEAIKGGENLLLTFTRIRNEVGKGNDIFNQAAQAALDLSVRFNKDLPASAVLVGKALNDPIRGLTALRRVGVSFTDDQVKLIKRLAESGNMLEAQRLILRELTVETGGAAKAYGDTLPGQLSKLRETFVNLGGTIAAEFSPQISDAVERAQKWIENSENQERVMNAVKDAAHVVSGVFNALRGVLENLNRVTGSTKDTLKLLFTAFIAYRGLRLASTFANMASQIGLIGTNAGGATGKVDSLRGSLKLLGAIGVVTVEIELIRRYGVKGGPGPFREEPGGVSQPGRSGFDDFLHLGAGGGQPSWLGKKLFPDYWKGEGGVIGGGDLPWPEAPSGAMGMFKPAVLDRAIGAMVKQSRQQVVDAVEKAGKKGLTGAERAAMRNAWYDATIGRQLDILQDLAPTAQLAEYDRIIAGLRAQIAKVVDRTRKLNLGDELRHVIRERRQVAADIKQAGVDAAQERADAAKERAAEAAQRRQDAADRRQAIAAGQIDRKQFALEMAQRTETLRDDITAQGGLVRLLERQISTLGRTKGRTQDLIRARADLAELVKQDRAQRKEDAAEAAKDARERAQRRAQRQQFAALGLTGEGETPLPSLRNLRQRLANLRRLTAGTEFARPELFANVAKILAGGFGKVGKETVSAIDRVFKDINEALNKKTEELGQPHRMRAFSASGFVNRFAPNLTAEQRRRFQAALAQAGPTLQVPAGAPIAFSSAGVTVHGGVHLHGVQNVAQLENELHKRERGRPHVRRGAR